MSWKIVAHSLSLLFRNFADALKVSVGPILLMVLFGWLAFAALGVSPQMLAFGLMTGRIAPAALLAVSLGVVGVLFASAWIAVAWHRFILLEEYPGLLPAIPGGRIAAYAGRSILLAILMVLLMFPVSAVVGQVLLLAGLAQLALAQGLVGFGLATLFTFLWLRIAVVLPATAVGRPYSLSQGWNDGSRLSSEIFNAAAIVVALNMVASLILGLLPVGLWPGLVLQAALTWVTMMVGTSLLTTLYGHLVEGRSLP